MVLSCMTLDVQVSSDASIIKSCLTTYNQELPDTYIII